MAFLGYFFIFLGGICFLYSFTDLIHFFKVGKFEKVEGEVVKINITTGTVGNDLDCEIVTPLAQYVYGEKTYFMNVVFPANPNDYPLGNKVVIAVPQGNPTNPIYFTPKIWLRKFYEGLFWSLTIMGLGIFFVVVEEIPIKNLF